jgi:hypothetical protein
VGEIRTGRTDKIPYEQGLLPLKWTNGGQMTIVPSPQESACTRHAPEDEECRPRWMPVFGRMPQYDGALVFQRERFDASRIAPGAATKWRGAWEGRAQGRFSLVSDNDRPVEGLFRFLYLRSILCVLKAAFGCVGAGGLRT